MTIVTTKTNNKTMRMNRIRRKTIGLVHNVVVASIGLLVLLQLSSARQHVAEAASSIEEAEVGESTIIDCSPNYYKLRLDLEAECDWGNDDFAASSSPCYRGIQCGSPISDAFDVTEIIVAELGNTLLGEKEILKQQRYQRGRSSKFETGDVLEYMSDPNIHPMGIRVTMKGNHDPLLGNKPQRISQLTYRTQCDHWPIIHTSSSSSSSETQNNNNNARVGQVEFLEIGDPPPAVHCPSAHTTITTDNDDTGEPSSPAVIDCSPTYYDLKLNLEDLEDEEGGDVSLASSTTNPCLLGYDYDYDSLPSDLSSFKIIQIKVTELMKLNTGGGTDDEDDDDDDDDNNKHRKNSVLFQKTIDTDESSPYYEDGDILRFIPSDHFIQKRMTQFKIELIIQSLETGSYDEIEIKLKFYHDTTDNEQCGSNTAVIDTWPISSSYFQTGDRIGFFEFIEVGKPTVESCPSLAMENIEVNDDPNETDGTEDDNEDTSDTTDNGIDNAESDVDADMDNDEDSDVDSGSEFSSITIDGDGDEPSNVDVETGSDLGVDEDTGSDWTLPKPTCKRFGHNCKATKCCKGLVCEASTPAAASGVDGDDSSITHKCVKPCRPLLTRCSTKMECCKGFQCVTRIQQDGSTIKKCVPRTPEPKADQPDDDLKPPEDEEEPQEQDDPKEQQKDQQQDGGDDGGHSYSGKNDSNTIDDPWATMTSKQCRKGGEFCTDKQVKCCGELVCKVTNRNKKGKPVRRCKQPRPLSKKTGACRKKNAICNSQTSKCCGGLPCTKRGLNKKGKRIYRCGDPSPKQRRDRNQRNKPDHDEKEPDTAAPGNDSDGDDSGGEDGGGSMEGTCSPEGDICTSMKAKCCPGLACKLKNVNSKGKGVLRCVNKREKPKPHNKNAKSSGTKDNSSTTSSMNAAAGQNLNENNAPVVEVVEPSQQQKQPKSIPAEKLSPTCHKEAGANCNTGKCCKDLICTTLGQNKMGNRVRKCVPRPSRNTCIKEWQPCDDDEYDKVSATRSSITTNFLGVSAKSSSNARCCGPLRCIKKLGSSIKRCSLVKNENKLKKHQASKQETNKKKQKTKKAAKKKKTKDKKKMMKKKEKRGVKPLLFG